MDIFKTRLKKLRVDAELSQAKLAKILGVAQQTINGWENTAKQPDMEMITRLATLFDVSADYLLGMSDEFNYKKKSKEFKYDYEDGDTKMRHSVKNKDN